MVLYVWDHVVKKVHNYFVLDVTRRARDIISLISLVVLSKSEAHSQQQKVLNLWNIFEFLPWTHGHCSGDIIVEWLSSGHVKRFVWPLHHYQSPFLIWKPSCVKKPGPQGLSVMMAAWQGNA
jgi:hypothetical protein